MSTKQIPVTFSWNAEERMWVARSESPPAMARGATTEDAEIFIKREIASKLGRQPFELNLKVEVPEGLKPLADKCNKLADEIKRLSDELPRLRTEFLHSAKGEYRLRHAEAAEILRMSASYLSKTLAKVSKVETTSLSEQISRATPRKRS